MLEVMKVETNESIPYLDLSGNLDVSFPSRRLISSLILSGNLLFLKGMYISVPSLFRVSIMYKSIIKLLYLV